ncbi:RNA12 protein-domain-containing protein [Mycena amicta]|nr:RNA12 protein-domain-containing protein [Mycena amicta]
MSFRLLPPCLVSLSKPRKTSLRKYTDAAPQVRQWAYFHQSQVLDALRARLDNVKSHGFSVVELEAHTKDGGVFVTFQYTDETNDREAALKNIETEVQNEAAKHGGLPSLGRGHGANAWLVKGIPWIEDMWRLSSKFVNVSFEGPDVGEERLYRLMRPYGYIQNMLQPATFPAGTRRFITFDHWLTNHPRITLPILLFLLGGISYAIFDPIRYLMVKAKMQNWFNSRVYRWLHAKSVELRIINPEPEANEEVWKERKQAEKDARSYLTDWPSTIAFVHGPQGSGKTHMLDTVLADSKRTVLTIDCRKLQDAASDVRLVNSLARQVGYWPVFSFLNSLSHLIDLVSVGVMGQKGDITLYCHILLTHPSANLSSSLPEQVREMLFVVRSSIKSVGKSRQRDAQRQSRRTGQQEERTPPTQKGEREMQAVWSLPVVVIKNFNGRGREEVFDVIAEWAALLIEQELAHVVVVTDNRENAKRLTKALPFKPLQTIALSDADAPSALAFVKRRLRDARIDLEYTHEQVASVQRLGGRASDLETLVHKVRNGATVDEAVEDIIARGVDAKSLPWSREEVWSLFKHLSSESEVPYYHVLLDFPFKGDESALRSLEHAEIISIRPSWIRPGRPVYRYVFERLVRDPIFQATQDIALNEKLISSYKSTIQSCEQELRSLNGRSDSYWQWGGNTTRTRARHIFSKINSATLKIETLERQNAELKKVLEKGG